MAEHIKFDAWLRALAKNSNNSFVRNSENTIQQLFELDRSLPSRYGWLATSVEALGKQLEGAKSGEEVNKIYWQDMAHNIEAYEVMVLWRGTELMTAALHSLNPHEILAPAVLSRSLLELAAASIANSNIIQNTIENVIAASMSRAGLHTCGQLEALLLQIIHGTRISEPPEHIKQKNILTYIEKVSKHPDGKDLRIVYDILCDFAHPNLLGNARFWAATLQKMKDDSSMVIMDRHAESVVTTETYSLILWALGWSSSCIRTSHILGQKAVQAILKRWPESI